MTLAFFLQNGIYKAPYVLFTGGYWAGASYLVFGGAFWYSGIIFIDTMYAEADLHGNRERVRHTYGEIVMDAFKSKVASQLVTLMLTFQFFISSVGLLSSSGTLLLHSFPDVISSLSTWKILCALILLPLIVWFDDLKGFAKLGVFKMVLRNTYLVLILGFCIYKYNTWNLHAFGSQSNHHQILTSVAIVMRPNAINASLHRVEKSMETPKMLPKVLVYSFITVSILKLLFGFIGVATFQDGMKYFLNDNLHNILLQRITCINTIIMIFLAYPFTFNQLLNYGLSETSIFSILINYTSRKWLDFSFKVISFICIVIMALIFKNVAVITAINGGINVNILCLIFPCLFHILLRRKSSKWYIIVTNVFIIILASIFCGASIYNILAERNLTNAIQ